MKAFAQAVPERLTAGGSTTAGLLIFGWYAARWRDRHLLRDPWRRRRRTGRPRRHAGGARPPHQHHEHAGRDRRSRVHDPASTSSACGRGVGRRRPPSRRRRHGPHLHGLGRRAFTLTTMFERRVVPPYGLVGGGDGAAVPRHAASRGRRAAASSEARRTWLCSRATALSWKRRAAAVMAGHRLSCRTAGRQARSLLGARHSSAAHRVSKQCMMRHWSGALPAKTKTHERAWRPADPGKIYAAPLPRSRSRELHRATCGCRQRWAGGRSPGSGRPPSPCRPAAPRDPRRTCARHSGHG